MKDYLRELIHEATTPTHARNIAREHLQARILGVLQDAGAMIPLAFHGGTALRFLFHNARYSEDLDFALEREPSRYDFRSYLNSIRKTFLAEGYALELKVNDRKTFHSAFVRFPGLLYELNISPHRSETLAVKLEVDTKPPVGAQLDTTIVRRYLILNLQHHDKASLLAGKLHAILQRPFLKGRDVYDLVWYLSDPAWPAPNMVLLNNALQQTKWQGPALTLSNWRKLVWEQLESADWKGVVEDVRPFVERASEAEMLNRENVKRLLEKES